MLRQAENTVKIEGVLSEVDIKPGTFKKNGQIVDSIGGTIIVKVNQTINNEEKELTIPVHMFASKLTNDGRPNPAYASIEKVANEFVSIASAGGEEGADRVRITSGAIEMNEYYSRFSPESFCEMLEKKYGLKEIIISEEGLISEIADDSVLFGKLFYTPSIIFYFCLLIFSSLYSII